MFFPTVLLLSFASVVNAQNDDFALLDDGQIDELREEYCGLLYDNARLCEDDGQYWCCNRDSELVPASTKHVPSRTK